MRFVRYQEIDGRGEQSRRLRASSGPILEQSLALLERLRIDQKLKTSSVAMLELRKHEACGSLAVSANVQNSVVISTMVAVRACRNSIIWPRLLKMLKVSHNRPTLSLIMDSSLVTDRFEKNGLSAALLDLWRSCWTVPKTGTPSANQNKSHQRWLDKLDWVVPKMSTMYGTLFLLTPKAYRVS